MVSSLLLQPHLSLLALMLPHARVQILTLLSVLLAGNTFGATAFCMVRPWTHPVMCRCQHQTMTVLAPVTGLLTLSV